MSRLAQVEEHSSRPDYAHPLGECRNTITGVEVVMEQKFTKVMRKAGESDLFQMQ